MIKICFFAQFREQLGMDSYEIDSATVNTVSDVLVILEKDIEGWSSLVDATECLGAVNQTLVSKTHPVVDGDEVAFFPPVTGG